MHLCFITFRTRNYFSRRERIETRERVVSERYILKNTESVVSGLIQTKVLLEKIEFLRKLYLNDTY